MSDMLKWLEKNGDIDTDVVCVAPIMLKGCSAEIQSLQSTLQQVEGERNNLLQEAQIQAQEMRTQRGVVREIYQLCTGSTGEPGDWNGAKPVRELIAQVTALATALSMLKNQYEVLARSKEAPRLDDHELVIAQAALNTVTSGEDMVLVLKREIKRFIDAWNDGDVKAASMYEVIKYFDWINVADKCEHGKGMTDYCLECGRVNNA